MVDTLCPISTLNQQITNLERTHIRWSLHCERWTVKGKDCASAMHSFKEINYRTDEWTKQLLQFNSWMISRNPEQWMKFRRLWWSYLFLSVAIRLPWSISIVWWFKICCFFENFTIFLPFLWWLWVRIISSSTSSI